MKHRSCKLLPVLRAMDAFTAPAQPEPQPQPQDAVTCHRCGAPVEPDARKVQTAADGTPKLGSYLCRTHMVAFAEKLKAAIREQRERDARERARREGGVK